jgi:hypothetical protein
VAPIFKSLSRMLPRAACARSGQHWRQLAYHLDNRISLAELKLGAERSPRQL